jgi:hypothetical protein
MLTGKSSNFARLYIFFKSKQKTDLKVALVEADSQLGPPHLQLRQQLLQHPVRVRLADNNYLCKRDLCPNSGSRMVAAWATFLNNKWKVANMCVVSN